MNKTDQARRTQKHLSKPYPVTGGISEIEHNHVVNEPIKEFGECPKCDDIHKSTYLLKYKSEINKLKVAIIRHTCERTPVMQYHERLLKDCDISLEEGLAIYKRLEAYENTKIKPRN